jgi:hypothetical protein
MADTAMEAKDTPLQEKLEAMATHIGYFGFIFAILTFIAMIVSWFVDNSKLKADFSQTEWIIHAVITSVTIIVVAIPEGLVRADVWWLLCIWCLCLSGLRCLQWVVWCGVVWCGATAPGRHHFPGLLHAQDVEGPEPDPCAGCVRDDGQRNGHLQ